MGEQEKKGCLKNHDLPLVLVRKSTYERMLTRVRVRTVRGGQYLGEDKTLLSYWELLPRMF